MANSVYQYEQPRCPDGWNEAERRFYNRLIQVLDDIYAKYGRIDAKLLDKSVINKIETAPETALEKAVADVISAGNIAADKFQGTFAYLVSLSAKYGDFDFETVKNLVADALVLEKGQANEVHITNLSATYAQAVRATIGSLCIKSKDGGYFQLDVDSDGRVSAVWGTHTHVPTADTRVLPKGTGYVTDLGMTGPVNSVLGIRPQQSIETFLGGLPGRYQVADGPCKMQGVVHCDIGLAAAEMPHIRVKGLMSIMPIETKLLYYQKMYALFLDKREYLVHNICSDNISMDYLSMGMSSDYETAVRCGSNMVRLGRCLFQ